MLYLTFMIKDLNCVDVTNSKLHLGEEMSVHVKHLVMPPHLSFRCKCILILLSVRSSDEGIKLDEIAVHISTILSKPI